MLRSIATAASSLLIPSSSAPYVVDLTFRPYLPAGASRVTGVAVALSASGSEVLLAQQRNMTIPWLCLYTKDSMGAFRGTCDEGDTSTMDSPHGAQAAADTQAGAGVFVTDIAGGTVKLFSQDGRLLATGGMQGHPGVGLNPIQFSAPADIAVTKSGRIVVSDGDGGEANRVVALASGATLNSVVWVIGKNGTGSGEFQSPHSIAYDSSTDTLFVADRGNERVVLLSPTDGSVIDTWGATCFPGGTPWGLRVDSKQRRLVVADGAHASVFVLDLGSEQFPSCNFNSNISIPTSLCVTPHELAISPVTGDIFVACVGATTGIVRLAAQGAVAKAKALRG